MTAQRATSHISSPATVTEVGRGRDSGVGGGGAVKPSDISYSLLRSPPTPYRTGAACRNNTAADSIESPPSIREGDRRGRTKVLPGGRCRQEQNRRQHRGRGHHGGDRGDRIHPAGERSGESRFERHRIRHALRGAGAAST